MNTKQKVRLIAGCAMFAAACFGVARGADSGAGQADAKAGVTGAVAVDTASCSATVQAIDHGKRTVTLRVPDGSEATLHAGKDVINFDQIEVGDEVKATLVRSLAIYARKPGVAANANQTTTIALAPKGDMPGALIANTVEVTNKIIDIDQSKRLVTLEGVEGKPQTIHLGSRVDLAALKKGDEVVVRCTEGVLIRVEKGPAEVEQVAAAKLPGAVAVETIKTEAKVTAIDKDRRAITLECPDGSEQTFKAGKDIANFDQIKVGDEVKATLVNELAIFARKPNSPAVDGETAAVALAPRGALPGVIMADTTQVTDKIEAIDSKERMITLEDADGHSRIIHLGPKVQINELQKGDDVVIRVTEGLALAVEK